MGIIESWEKKDGKIKPYYVLKLTDDKETYNFFDITEDEINLAPIGTSVEFEQVQRGKYWNFKPGSFIVRRVPKIDPKKIPASVEPVSKDRIIVRQNAGHHAAEYIKVLYQVDHDITPEDMKKAFFDFAEEFEKWVFR